MGATASVRERCRRVDVLTPAVGVVALVIYALHGFDGVLSRDLAVYSYAAQRVVDGVPPYEGILNRAGPLAHVIPALGVVGARVVGIGDLLGMRLLFMLIAVAAVCVTYLLAKELFASRLAGLAAATTLLSAYGFIEYASYGPREKTPMVLFLLCILLAVVKQRWFAAGLFLALGTLIWQPAFFVGLMAVAVALAAVPRSDRLPSVGRFILGGVVPTAICLLYFVVAGALPEFIEAFVLLNAAYTPASPLGPGLAQMWLRLQAAYGMSLWATVCGLGVLVVLAAAGVPRDRWLPRSRAISVAAVSAASLVAVAWTFRDFDGWPDLFVLLPLGAVGIGGVVYVLAERLSPAGVTALTLAWVVVGVTVAASYSVTERDHRLQAQRASVAAVLGRLPSDVSVLSVMAPQPLVLSRKANPTRHQMFADGLDRYVDNTWPGGLRGYSDWIELKKPTVISVGGRVPAWLRTTLKEGYQRVGRPPEWAWYVDRSIGPDAIAALHKAANRRRRG